MAVALWDLTRPGRRVRGDSRLIWALVIVLANFVGPIVYFVAGREDIADEADAGLPARDALPGQVVPTQAGVPPLGPPTRASPATPPSSTAAPAPPGGSVSAAPSSGGPAPGPGIDPLSLPGAPVRGLPVHRPLTPGESAISARALTKRFGTGESSVLALDRLDLDVPAGSVFGLLGPNGAGKTTTLRILSGLAHSTGGTATVAGIQVDAGGPALTARIGYLDQDPRYYGWMSGRELVTLVGRLHGFDGYLLERRAEEVLEQVGLASAADRRVESYSGGMRQRLGIAQALVNQPPLLILDEPVSSLDPEGRRDLLALIAELRGTATVLFSTHVLSDVERICDRVAILDHGHLVTEGPLDELLDRYASPIYRLEPEPGQESAVATLVERLRAATWATDVTAAHGLLRVTVSDPAWAAREILPVVVEAGVALAAYERVRPTLEDVFIELVGRDRTGNVA